MIAIFGLVPDMQAGFAGGRRASDAGADVAEDVGCVRQGAGREQGREPGGPMIAVVTNTGNAGADEGHVGIAMSGDDRARFAWSFAPQCGAQSKLDLWTDCAGDVAVELRHRSGSGPVIPAPAGSRRTTSTITTEDGTVVGVCENRGMVRSGLRSIRMLLYPGLHEPWRRSADGCIFDVTVRPADAGDGGIVHAWLERDCAHGVTATLRQTHRTRRGRGSTGRGAPPAADGATLTSIACAPSIIAVAGLDNAAADDCVLAMSGRGPRPWPGAGRLTESLPSPLFAAPASGLFGARSKTRGFMRGSGTSGAAAIGAGALALAMQAADLGGRRLDTGRLISALLGRAIDPADATGWLPDLGYGALRFDASAVLGGVARNATSLTHSKEKPSDERTIPPAN